MSRTRRLIPHPGARSPRVPAVTQATRRRAQWQPPLMCALRGRATLRQAGSGAIHGRRCTAGARARPAGPRYIGGALARARLATCAPWPLASPTAPVAGAAHLSTTASGGKAGHEHANAWLQGVTPRRRRGIARKRGAEPRHPCRMRGALPAFQAAGGTPARVAAHRSAVQVPDETALRRPTPRNTSFDHPPSLRSAPGVVGA
jgi:hypothetical protein